MLTPVLDTNDEFDETVTVTITSGSYDISSTNDSASIDIKDAPVVKIEATDSTASEGNPVNTGRFYVSSTSGHVPGGSFTVDLEFLSTSSNPVADLNVDYTVNPSESSSPPVISFTLLDTGDFQNVTVTPINDANMSEGFEDVRLRIQDADGAAIDSANRQATVTIADNGGVGVPNVSVFADFVTAQEGMSPVGRFRLTRSGATTSSLTVPLTAVTNPSGAPQATSADYTLSDGLTSLPGSVTFNPGDFVAYIMVDGILDTVEEGEELTVQITTNPGLYYVVDPLATIAIADTPTVSISTEDGAASEDGDTGQFKISRTGASNSDALTVHLSLAGTATFSTSPTSGDYTVTNLSPSGSNYTAQIPAGADYVLVTIVPNSDSVPDDAETVSLSIIDPAPAGAVYAVGLSLIHI